MIKIGVIGARGRMGRRIIKLAGQDKELEAVLGFEAGRHPDAGKTIDGVKITDDFEQAGVCDCLIDFSLPEATLASLPYLVRFKKPVVIGTTGLSRQNLDEIKKASEAIPVVYSPNMSIGVNLLFKLLKEAAKTLKGYSVNIEESHHIHKKDAPSGTAKKIAEVINSRGFKIKEEGIKSIREGETVGDHRVVFESDVDEITLSHHAKTRDIFAKGSLVAAKWLVGKSRGLYSMEDVLGL